MSETRSNLKRKAVTGVKWAFVGRFVERAIRFATMIVLARLLLPEEFGLFALGVAVAGALTYIKSLGVDAALVQRKDAFEGKVADTAFVMLALSGGLLYLLFFLLMPWYTKYDKTKPEPDRVTMK